MPDDTLGFALRPLRRPYDDPTMIAVSSGLRRVLELVITQVGHQLLASIVAAPIDDPEPLLASMKGLRWGCPPATGRAS